jgi:uncharacterized protein YlzI (FlbEa/FlbD family)
MNDFIELNYDDDLVMLRPDRIESIRPWNDGLTYIWMYSGYHYTVKETPQEILAKIEEWKTKNGFYRWAGDANELRKQVEKKVFEKKENRLICSRCDSSQTSLLAAAWTGRCGACGYYNIGWHIGG